LPKAPLGLSGLGALSGCATADKAARARAPLAAAQPDLVRRENSRPGSRDWLLQKTAVDPRTKYRCPWIEGYGSRTSVRAGETIQLHVSTNPPSRFALDLYRMGYYGGAGGRLMKQLGPFEGMTQIDPPIGAKRRRDCAWEPCASLTIPRDVMSCGRHPSRGDQAASDVRASANSAAAPPSRNRASVIHVPLPQAGHAEAPSSKHFSQSRHSARRLRGR